MGIGKTSVCLEIKKKLRNAIFLDGDWVLGCRPVSCSSILDEGSRSALVTFITIQ